MSSSFQKKSSTIIATLFIGLIIVSFLFTGYMSKGSMGTGPGDVAKVGKYSVSIQEFQMAFTRQIQFYKQMMGGADLTNKQIEQFGLKNSVLSSLVQQKLLLNFADQINLTLSDKQIMEEIQTLPYFKTNEQFDISKYKILLSQNGYTPAHFEEMIGGELTVQNVQQLIANSTVSKTLIKDVLGFKNQALKVTALKMPKKNFEKLVPVSEEEITNFTKNEANSERIKALFNDKKAALTTSEQVKARHILISTEGKDEKAVLAKVAKVKSEINLKNFSAKARELSDDPSGKENGGDLDWIPRGKMVKEFEDAAFALKPGIISEPVKTMFGYHFIVVDGKKEAYEPTLDKHKHELAKELVQKDKAATELPKAEREFVDIFSNLLTKDELKTIEEKKKELDFLLVKNSEMNRYDGAAEAIELQQNEVKEIFNNFKTKKVFVLNSASFVVIVKVLSSDLETKAVEPTKEAVTAEQSALKNQIAKNLQTELMKHLEKEISISTNTSALGI